MHPPHIGFTITPAEIAAAVSNYITTAAVTGWANLGAVIGGLKTSPELRWASPLDVKNAVETAFTEKFGTKEAAKPKGKVNPYYENNAVFTKSLVVIGTQKGDSQNIETICNRRSFKCFSVLIKKRFHRRFPRTSSQSGREPPDPSTPPRAAPEVYGRSRTHPIPTRT